MDTGGVIDKRSIPQSYRRPFVLGITGPSGSGKSTLAAGLCEKMRRAWGRAFLLAEDPAFFRSPAARSYRDRDPTSETPDHVEWDAYREALRRRIDAAATSGGSDSDGDGEGGGGSKRGERRRRRTVLIVEHFLMLHDERIVELLDGIIFLDPSSLSTPASPDDDNDADAMWTCMGRRVLRNPQRSAQEILFLCRYYQDHVWSNYKKWTWPKARNIMLCHEKTRSDANNGREEAGDRTFFLCIDCRNDASSVVDRAEISLRAWLEK